MKFRTEREMMLELALVAERDDVAFKLFNLSLVLSTFRAACQFIKCRKALYQHL